jgi:hypothetical protein
VLNIIVYDLFRHSELINGFSPVGMEEQVARRCPLTSRMHRAAVVPGSVAA